MARCSLRAVLSATQNEGMYHVLTRCHCLQVPTTLMAAIDASVGIKTAVNFQDKKNKLGTYCPPLAVFLDRYAGNRLHCSLDNSLTAMCEHSQLACVLFSASKALTGSGHCLTCLSLI
jgi:3-dehydroquinate synthase